MKKRTRNQLDDDDFPKLCLARFRQGDQILFPREGRIFPLLEHTRARFSLANTPTNTEEKSNRRKDNKEEVVYDI